MSTRNVKDTKNDEKNRKDKELITKLMVACDEHCLKLTVLNTAVIFFRKIEKALREHENHTNVNCLNITSGMHTFVPDESQIDLYSDDFISALLSLSCKTNDLSAPAAIRKGRFYEHIAVIESLLPTLFNFRLHVPCPFVRLLGMLICLAERGIVSSADNKLFFAGVVNIKLIMVDENYAEYGVNEVAAAALPVPRKYLKKLWMGDMDYDQIEKIRKDNNIKI